MTKTDPQIINLNKVKVVGFCHRCQQRILDCNPVWVVNADEILCPYYNARKLAFCSKYCLEKQTEFVLEQLRTARQKGDQSNQ